MASYALGGTPRVRCGIGARDTLAAEIPAHVTDILLVTDAGIDAAGIADRVRGALPHGVTVETAHTPNHEPTVASVDAIAEQARHLARPLILGVGGGTVLDTAKLVAGLHPVRASVTSYLLGGAAFEERRPSIMVPTTAGTGSEGTRTCIVTDSQDRKCWVFGDALLPDAIVLDAELTAGLPPHLTLATGIDAFVHAFEAASAQAANAFSRAQGLHAIRLARTHLGPAAAAGSDLTARQGMQEAAMLAGFAIDSAGTGMAHNIGHALGSLYHVPHGVAVAVGLAASIDWTVSPSPAGFDDVAQAMDREAAGGDVPALYRAWLQELGTDWLCRGLGEAPVDGADLARAMAAPENAPMATNNARQPTDHDLDALARSTLTGCDAYVPSHTAVGG